MPELCMQLVEERVDARGKTAYHQGVELCLFINGADNSRVVQENLRPTWHEEQAITRPASEGMVTILCTWGMD